MSERKKIGIVSLGYAWLPCEPGPSRFYYIAKAFADAGWEVDFIGSSFQHFEKKPRDRALIAEQHYPFKVTFIDVPPYKKNIDPRRVMSNSVARTRVVKYLESQYYDVVYCSIPANDVSAAVGKYCQRKHIPFIVDVEDLWPEAMKMVIGNKLVQKAVFPGFLRDAETTYVLADAVVGTSEDYTERATRYNHRTLPQRTVYVGCDMAAFDRGVIENAKAIEKPDGEFWVTYAGSIGTSYDIQNLVLAAKELLRRETSTTVAHDRDRTAPLPVKNIRVKVLGTGPQKEECEELARAEGCTNVEFLGYVAYPEMAAWLNRSDAVINSFVKGAPQSIVNKVGDYLASCRPMINTLENPIFCKLVEENDIGINVEPGNPQALADAIISLRDDPESAARMGGNARALGENRFDRAQSYKEIVRLADDLLVGKAQ